MGAIQSINYPNDEPQKLNVSDLPVIRSNQINEGRNTNIIVDKGGIQIVEIHFKNQLENLKAYINMYFLYDGYDSKNKVILDDLEKKLKNQKDNLKELYEKNDKIKNGVVVFNEKINIELKKKRMNSIHILFLFSISIICIMFIIRNLRHYYIKNLL